ncbi:hypothetical protein BJX70DRAFT_402108 [Aspergillus crustosus]
MADIETDDEGCLLDFEFPLVRVLPDHNDNAFHGPVDIRASLVKVLHGHMGDRSAYGPFATLLVFKFRFDRQKHGRRIIRARMEVEFSSVSPRSSRSEVYAIDPEDRFSIFPTADTVETKAGLGLEIGASYAGVNGSLERTRSMNIDDATTVTGSIDLAADVNAGPPNCASWTLLENKTRKTSVPDLIRTSTLLKIETNEPFQGKVTLRRRADLHTEINVFSEVAAITERVFEIDNVTFDIPFEMCKGSEKSHVDLLSADVQLSLGLGGE